MLLLLFLLLLLVVVVVSDGGGGFIWGVCEQFGLVNSLLCWFRGLCLAIIGMVSPAKFRLHCVLRPVFFPFLAPSVRHFCVTSVRFVACVGCSISRSVYVMSVLCCFETNILYLTFSCKNQSDFLIVLVVIARLYRMFSGPGIMKSHEVI